MVPACILVVPVGNRLSYLVARQVCRFGLDFVDLCCAMSKQKKYRPVDRSTYELIKQQLRARGMSSAQGDNGVAHAAGVRMGYSYSEPDQSLTLTIQHKPALMPTSLVWKTLERFVTAQTNARESQSSERERAARSPRARGDRRA